MATTAPLRRSRSQRSVKSPIALTDGAFTSPSGRSATTSPPEGGIQERGAADTRANWCRDLRSRGAPASKQNIADSALRLRIDAIAEEEHLVAQGGHFGRVQPPHIEPLVEGPVSAIT